MGLLDQVFSIIARDNFSGVYSNLHAKQQQAGKGFDTMGAASKVLGVNLGSLSGLLGSLGIGFSALQLGKTALDLGNLGAQSLVTKQSFESVTASVGKTTALLDQMKAAAGGTIDELRLMQLANTALAGASGETGAAFADLIPRLIEGARAANKLNPALGDTEFLFQSLVTGIKRGSPLLIDNTGITLSIAEANQRMADSLGKSVTALTEEEKQLALMGETAKGVDRIVAQSGGNLDTMATSASKTSTAFKELKTAIGEALAPTISGLQNTVALNLQGLAASIGGTELDKASAELSRLQGVLAEYTGWVGKNQSAEDARLRTVAAVKDAIAQQETAVRQLTQAYEASNLSKAEQETRRIVGVSIDASDAMTQQEKEARRLAGGMNAAAAATDTFSGKTARMSAIIAGAVGMMRKMADEAAAAADAMAERSVGQITGGLLGATDVITLQQYKGNIGATETAVKALTAAYNGGAIDLDTYNYKVAELTDNNNDWIAGLRESAKAVDALGASADNTAFALQSMIDSELTPSFSLSELAPELATQEGNIDEHYRRLAAIALRGGEELTKHAQDWQDTLSLIPPDVQAQGVAAIQEWAKAQVQAYDQGLDFSLIDKGAIKDRILRQLQANEARDAVIAEIAASLGNISMADVEAAAKDAGLGGEGGKGTIGKISLGIEDSVDVDAMLRTTAAAITSGAQDKHAKALRESGKVVGGVILGGITTAVTEGAGDIISLLAAAVTPSVLAAVEARNRRTGGIPPS